MSQLPILKPGQIVYCQGRYKCRVIADEETSILYAPLEGAPPEQIGKCFRAARDLFTLKRETRKKIRTF